MGLLKACRVCFSSDRGFAVGIYTTNSPEACQYVADNCKANILVVENHKQLQKILQVSPGINDKDKALDWEHQLAQLYDNKKKKVLFVGEGLSSLSLFNVTKGLTNWDICLLIFTSHVVKSGMWHKTTHSHKMVHKNEKPKCALLLHDLAKIFPSYYQFFCFLNDFVQ